MPRLRSRDCESIQPGQFTVEICLSICSGRTYKGYWNGRVVALRILHYKGVHPTPQVRLHGLQPLNDLSASFSCGRSSNEQFKYATCLLHFVDRTITEMQRWLKLAHPHVLRSYAALLTRKSFTSFSHHEQHFWVPTTWTTTRS